MTSATSFIIVTDIDNANNKAELMINWLTRFIDNIDSEFILKI